MTQQEHLNRIRARCVELLEIAKHRTPELWNPSFDTTGFPCVASVKDTRIATTDLSCSRFGVRQDDTTFIASCAGAAEAGWKATIAAIDTVTGLQKVPYGWDGDCGASAYADNLADSIIAPWPEELL
jgi:hypothetical protein